MFKFKFKTENTEPVAIGDPHLICIYNI